MNNVLNTYKNLDSLEATSHTKLIEMIKSVQCSIHVESINQDVKTGKWIAFVITSKPLKKIVKKEQSFKEIEK